jgi:arylsulfatase A-like enzyme
MADKILHARWPWLLAALVVALLYLASLVVLQPGDPRPEGGAPELLALAERSDVNVLFVLIDTVRAHRLGGYGYERDTSPSLDYLARNGVRFARHLAQSSWTKASMASLWTGRNPDRTGVKRFNHVIPEEATLPAEIFLEAGFRTGGIYRNGWVSPNFGFSQGFEIYERPFPNPAPATVRRESPHFQLRGTDDEAMEAAMEFLHVHGSERWFLYLHLMDVHQYLYDEANALFGTRYSDTYDNSLHREDAVIAGLLNHLSRSGHLSRTLVVISSDHGEAFNERGLDGHAKHVYRESTEVPFILSLPFRLPGGAVVATLSRNVDVWPTVLDLLGLPPLPDTDGSSLVPEILANLGAGTEPVGGRRGAAYLDRTWGLATREPSPAVAIVEDDFRFVYTVDGEREELFDRGTDPTERTNVIVEEPEVAVRLKEAALHFLEPKPAPWGVETPTVDIDELQLRQLRALGYKVE